VLALLFSAIAKPDITWPDNNKMNKGIFTKRIPSPQIWQFN
jgi:hypothetical protein